MIIFVQFPVADIRNFTTRDTAKLNRPYWPLPSAGEDFVRSFGGAKKRNKGGLTNWVGEDRVVLTNRLLNFPKPITCQTNSKINGNKLCTWSFKSASKHFYFDGLALAKFELTFLSTPGKHPNSVEIDDLLDRIFDTELKIKLPNVGVSQVQLWRAPKSLAYAYQLASTRTAQLDKVKEDRYLVTPRKPVIFIEFKAGDQIHYPKNSRQLQLESELGVNLANWEQKLHGKPFAIWAAQYSHGQIGSSKSRRRQLRMLLMRLHSEYQVLVHILGKVDSSEINFKAFTNQSDAFQTYLQKASNRITKKPLGNLLQGGLAEIECWVKDSFERVDPGHYESVLRSIERLNLRPQVSLASKEMIVRELMLCELLEKIDLVKLAGELGQIRAMLETSNNAAKGIADSQLVSAASNALQTGRRERALELLGKASRGVLDIAISLGANVVTEFLRLKFA